MNKIKLTTNNLIKTLFLGPAIFMWALIFFVSMFLSKRNRKRILNFYFPYKNKFRDIVTNIFYYGKLESKVRKMIDKFPFLEIGCGCGHFIETISERGLCFAVDIFKDKNIKGNPFHFVKCDCRNLPFKNGVFLTLYAEYVFHHLENVNLAIKESARVLKKDGKLILLEDPPNNYISKFFSDLNTSHYMHENEWKKNFLKDGFSKFHSKNFNFVLGSGYIFEVIK